MDIRWFFAAILWCALGVAQASEIRSPDSEPRQRTAYGYADAAPLGKMSVGLSAGLNGGIGPTIGLPLGHRHRVQLTALPILVGALRAASGGVRAQHFLGSNGRARLYMAEGVGMHRWADTTATAAGLGFGVETRKNTDTGRVAWLDVTMTAMAMEGRVYVLPVPQTGVAWYF